MLEDVRLTTVVVTALIDSINPCAIGVLILLVSTLVALAEDRKRMLFVGMIYITAIFITYFLAGLGLMAFIQRFELAQFIGLLVGSLIILMGFVDIKDFFAYGKGFSLGIKPKHVERIKVMAQEATIPGVIILGMFVAAVELPCTGGPYLAITALLARQFDFLAMMYLLLYNFIFVLPLVVIMVLAYIGITAAHLDKWKNANKKYMRLASGLLMVALGVILILFALDVIMV